MQSIAQVLPLRPGKTEAFKRYVTEETGPRRSERDAFHRKHGIHREANWLQSTPDGDLVIVYFEAEDVANVWAALGEIMTSDEPFLVWAREHLVECFGLDPTQPPPPEPEQLADTTVAV